MVRQRKTPKAGAGSSDKSAPASHPVAADMDNLPLVGRSGSGPPSVRAQWIFFAIASGACAAFNGVFAKLTTTELTTSLSNSIADLLGLKAHERIVELVVRGAFFALNLTFNGVMWSLFTTALARGTSTTQVSIMNTSTNFILTALMGLFIFGEDLPAMWWVGATLLVVGNVIVGRKDESVDEAAAEAGYRPIPTNAEEGLANGDEATAKSNADEDVADLGVLVDDRKQFV
ncbi:Transmembrane protein 42 [Paramyrothecium foliicola]|nr:Transmembrane protein 42 [Paramyrothecium foliicola]